MLKRSIIRFLVVLIPALIAIYTVEITKYLIYFLLLPAVIMIYTVIKNISCGRTAKLLSAVKTNLDLILFQFGIIFINKIVEVVAIKHTQLNTKLQQLEFLPEVGNLITFNWLFIVGMAVILFRSQYTSVADWFIADMKQYKYKQTLYNLIIGLTVGSYFILISTSLITLVVMVAEELCNLVGYPSLLASQVQAPIVALMAASIIKKIFRGDFSWFYKKNIGLIGSACLISICFLFLLVWLHNFVSIFTVDRPSLETSFSLVGRFSPSDLSIRLKAWRWAQNLLWLPVAVSFIASKLRISSMIQIMPSLLVLPLWYTFANNITLEFNIYLLATLTVASLVYIFNFISSFKSLLHGHLSTKKIKPSTVAINRIFLPRYLLAISGFYILGWPLLQITSLICALPIVVCLAIRLVANLVSYLLLISFIRMNF